MNNPYKYNNIIDGILSFQSWLNNFLSLNGFWFQIKVSRKRKK